MTYKKESLAVLILITMIVAAVLGSHTFAAGQTFVTPVTGTVIQDGNAVYGAGVTATCVRDNDFTTSDADGNYTLLVDTYSGHCDLHAEKDGWSSGYFGFDPADGWYNQVLNLMWHLQ